MTIGVSVQRVIKSNRFCHPQVYHILTTSGAIQAEEKRNGLGQIAVTRHAIFDHSYAP
jgi:hypothetical protein